MRRKFAFLRRHRNKNPQWNECRRQAAESGGPAESVKPAGGAFPLVCHRKASSDFLPCGGNLLFSDATETDIPPPQSSGAPALLLPHRLPRTPPQYSRDELMRMLDCFQTVVFMEHYRVAEIYECRGWNEDSRSLVYEKILERSEACACQA